MLFDSRWYRDFHADVAQSGLAAFAHYFTIGRHDSRACKIVGRPLYVRQVREEIIVMRVPPEPH
jgi:hypothetical protein